MNNAWKESHINECSINHKGSAEKMERDGAVQMFARSEDLHGVKYLSYNGDSNSKTFKSIVESQSYGEHIITKKEYVGYLQKRIGARLCKIKKDTKGLGEKGKLTANLIDELSVYYGLAIMRNKDSVNDMKKAICATLQHKSSTDENPQHDNCPSGQLINIRGRKQRLIIKNKLDEYTHKEALPDYCY
ncbi:uncharacterized protein LOC105429853 [Pogonomyrmex barbatus]|uniref:Uncharacterized protein LOC105429853 n=1 Tax=Pogonomyrmex barbatus TaxID=144034 RepID=A0A6I9WFN6_9HYME|nr:uncharacterized protein LOC105429853 [Pogonomyrmex barbatus]